MKRAAWFGGSVLVLVLAVWFSSSSKPGASAATEAAPIVIRVPPPIDAGVALIWPPPLPTDIEVLEPAMPDAGEAFEVTIEVFDEKGHAAGQRVELRNPPCAPDPAAGLEITRVATTNVMGFARVALTAGTWEVENFKAAPAKIEVGPGQTSFVLRKSDYVAGLIEGTVVDGLSFPVPGADVALAGGDEAYRKRVRAREENVHLPPLGDQRVWADDKGHFVLRTFEPSERLIATHARRSSREVDATANGKPTQLRLFTPAWARFVSACAVAFVQYEYGGDVIELEVRPGVDAMVAAGDRKFRMRCMLRGRLVSATTEVELRPGSHDAVVFDPKPMSGLSVRLADLNGLPLRGVTVVAKPLGLPLTASPNKSFANTTTDAKGLGVLVPPELHSYDPLFSLEVQGALRLQREVMARLGDQPVELVAVPATGR